MIEFVDLGRQYDSIREEVDRALLGAVASTQFILGEEVERFEEEFAAYCGTRRCVGVGSGTAALHLALEALGVGPGDEVVAPANTFIASVLPAIKLGARPILVDCDPDSALVTAELVEPALTERTRAVVAVDLYGQPVDAGPLRELCDERGVVFVEDACQAHGARYDGRRAGSLGHVAAFSFYPGKNLGAYGDGGAVTTDDAELADRVAVLRHLGQTRKYQHVEAGWNERLDTIQAAVLRVKLRHLERWNELRREHAAAYAELLDGAEVQLPVTVPSVEHVWHLYVIRCANRDEVRDALARAGIASGMHYPLPLHLQPALRSLGYTEGDFPATEAWARDLLSLPMFPELRRDELARVAEVVTRVARATSVEGTDVPQDRGAAPRRT